jgi:hypothetical protein
MIRITAGAQAIQNPELLQIRNIDNSALLEVAARLEGHRERVIIRAVALGAVAR